MKKTELVTSQEYWVETIEALQQLGHTNYDIATVIANKVEKAMNNIPCCTELKDRVKPTFDDWLKLNFKKINSTTYGNKNLDCVWLKSELREIYETISL